LAKAELVLFLYHIPPAKRPRALHIIEMENHSFSITTVQYRQKSLEFQTHYQKWIKEHGGFVRRSLP
jgi:hypothetical protein